MVQTPKHALATICVTRDAAPNRPLQSSFRPIHGASQRHDLLVQAGLRDMPPSSTTCGTSRPHRRARE